jgi:lipoprotein-anchoring transpeptidase ErfK/SrfK
MKQDLIIIFVFLFFVGLLVGSFRYLNFSSNGVSFDPALTRELLSDEYVDKNVLAADGEYDESQKEYVFNNKRYPLPEKKLRLEAMLPDVVPNVLGATTEEKHIVVDIKHQRVYAYEGDQLMFNFLVSTGYWGETPTGHYRIWYKVRSQAMKGGDPSKGDYYYLPNVQWVQFFNKAISFHSTYWHNNFGTPMSHGCVNMTTTDAQTLYYWASPVMPAGTRIFRSSQDNPGTVVDVVDSWGV